MTLRPTGTAVALTAVLLTAGTAAVAGSPVPLTRVRSLEVLSPRDGAVVAPDFLLSWSSTSGRTNYAVVVDAAIPHPGDVVRPDGHRLTVTTTSIRLTLGRARTGSPTARPFHTVTVIALDDRGRRVGSAAAVVHVRNRA